MRKFFADQFSQDTQGFTYRKNQKGAPIRVSSIERDDFIKIFIRRTNYALCSIPLAAAGLVLTTVLLTPKIDAPPFEITVFIGYAAISLLYIVFFYWAWNSPSRELQGRTPEGAGLAKEEARALALSKITYSRLALGAFIGLAVVWEKSRKADIFHGLGAVWLILGGGVIALAGVQAIRKWRFDRNNRSNEWM